MLYKVYRVEYYLKVGRTPEPVLIVSERVVAATRSQRLREGLRDPMILQHLIKHSCRLVQWEAEEI